MPAARLVPPYLVPPYLSSAPPDCHNGPNVPLRDANGDLWAPFHMYRSSTDIRPVHASIVLNLLSVPPLAALNLSLPGVWAYPDMLEVGVTNGQSGPVLSLTQAQSHFSAWCIVSAPLILGFNVTDTVNIDRVWPIISNKEALAINSDYAGFSGTVFATNETQIAYAPCGWWIASECGAHALVLSKHSHAHTCALTPSSRRLHGPRSPVAVQAPEQRGHRRPDDEQ
jgi:hypothetical protein